jgi:hypothetical protein
MKYTERLISVAVFKKTDKQVQSVATKYRDNYLVASFLELNRKIPFQERVKELLLTSC